MSTKWSLSHSYGYDSAGNATTFLGASKSYNNDNQISATGYAFDGNGNPTTYNSATLTYDPENRMTAYGSTVSNTYRADGLRASKTTSSGTTYFLYDGSEPIIEMNSSGTITAVNIFAPDGLIARQTSSTTTEYAFDQQGNVADRLNTSGAIQTVTQFDPYGGEHVADGTPADPFAYNAQSGYYLDRETGLYLCQHRFYDPANGRWINRDPMGFGGGTNLYGYCAGGPVGWTDTSGHQIDLDALPDTGVGGFVKGLAEGADGACNGADRFFAGLLSSDDTAGYISDTIYNSVMGLELDVANAGTDPVAAGRLTFLVASVAATDGMGEAAMAGDLILGTPELVVPSPEIYDGLFLDDSGGMTILRQRKVGSQYSNEWRIDFGRIPDNGDVIPWARGKKLPHYHRRPGIRKHRPWQGGF